MDEPVDDALGVVDFRTVNCEERLTFSPDLEEVLLNCDAALAWYADFESSIGGKPPALTGSYALDDDPKGAAREILAGMEWTPGVKDGNRDRTLTLRDAIEELGILVMRSSIVGNNTHRKLNHEEFRAFTLLERGFALIFINTADVVVGQLFSLAHELGHVLLGRAGVTGRRNDHRNVERWCNSFAAEFIFPWKEVERIWDKAGDPERFMKAAYRQYGVSKDTALWTLAEYGQLTPNEVRKRLEKERDWGNPSRNGGGDYYNNIPARLGARYLDIVSSALLDAQISEREATQHREADRSDPRPGLRTGREARGTREKCPREDSNLRHRL